MTPLMRAWRYHWVDTHLEDCLSILDDVPAPDAASLGKGQIIVEVVSASLNPVDYKIPESTVVGRLMIPRPATPGVDFCGHVAACHPSVTAFAKGQLVFGGLPAVSQTGSLGKYLVVSSDCCALLPSGVEPDQAAAVGTAATTAYQSLMPDTLKSGASIFINGGSGGVGTWAIQFAKALGAAHIVVTCSSRNAQLCRDLGADEVIDYQAENVVSALEAMDCRFDLVIDNVGDSSELFPRAGKLLTTGGTSVQVGVGEAMSLGGIVSTMHKSLWSVLGGTPYYFVKMNNSAEFFTRIGGWLAEGRVRAVIDETYSFESVPEAFAKLRRGRVRGKLVVHIKD